MFYMNRFIRIAVASGLALGTVLPLAAAEEDSTVDASAETSQTVDVTVCDNLTAIEKRLCLIRLRNQRIKEMKGERQDLRQDQRTERQEVRTMQRTTRQTTRQGCQASVAGLNGIEKGQALRQCLSGLRDLREDQRGIRRDLRQENRTERRDLRQTQRTEIRTNVRSRRAGVLEHALQMKARAMLRFSRPVRSSASSSSSSSSAVSEASSADSSSSSSASSSESSASSSQ
jgi:hypothetical protein